MLVKDIKDIIQKYYIECNDMNIDCERCSINNTCERVPLAKEEYEKILTLTNNPKESTDTPKVTSTANDIINHPAHYNREGAMESIEEMELIFGKEAVKWFCVCNAWKYRYRSAAKNGEEDIKKSDWYLRKYKELISNE